MDTRTDARLFLRMSGQTYVGTSGRTDVRLYVHTSSMMYVCHYVKTYLLLVIDYGARPRRVPGADEGS